MNTKKVLNECRVAAARQKTQAARERPGIPICDATWPCNTDRLSVANECIAAAEVWRIAPVALRRKLEPTMEELFTRLAARLLGVKV